MDEGKCVGELGSHCHRPVGPGEGFCFFSECNGKLLGTVNNRGVVLAGWLSGLELFHHLSHMTLVTETNSVRGDHTQGENTRRQAQRGRLGGPCTWHRQGSEPTGHLMVKKRVGGRALWCDE